MAPWQLRRGGGHGGVWRVEEEERGGRHSAGGGGHRGNGSVKYEWEGGPFLHPTPPPPDSSSLRSAPGAGTFCFATADSFRGIPLAAAEQMGGMVSARVRRAPAAAARPHTEKKGGWASLRAAGGTGRAPARVVFVRVSLSGQENVFVCRGTLPRRLPPKIPIMKNAQIAHFDREPAATMLNSRLTLYSTCLDLDCCTMRWMCSDTLCVICGNALGTRVTARGLKRNSRIRYFERGLTTELCDVLARGSDASCVNASEARWNWFAELVPVNHPPGFEKIVRQ
eukprot:gene25196-biopygen5985